MPSGTKYGAKQILKWMSEAYVQVDRKTSQAPFTLSAFRENNKNANPLLQTKYSPKWQII